MTYRESNERLVESLNERKYWEPTKAAFIRKIEEIKISRHVGEKEALILALNHLDETMRESEEGVGKLVAARKEAGEDLDEGQVSVSVAGHNFQALVAFALAINSIAGNLVGLHIAIKPKKHQIIEKYATIDVMGEKQKPDVDIITYKEEKKSPLIILSCKTSLRERAGQTYRWKLLLDLSSCGCPHIQDNPVCPVNKYPSSCSNETPPGSRCAKCRAPETRLPLAHAAP